LPNDNGFATLIVMAILKRISAIAAWSILVPLFSISAFAGADVIRTNFDNGLTLLTQEDHSTPLAAVLIIYHVGKKNECAGITGITHICTWIMSEGTLAFRKGGYSRTVQAGGGATQSMSDYDLTIFTTEIPTSMLDTILALESDRMKSTEVTYEKLMLAKDALRRQRLTEVESSIYGNINEEFVNLSFRSHPYSYPDYGWPADIENITLDDVSDYFDRYFQPSNATLVLLGDFSTETVVGEVRDGFGLISSNPPPRIRKIVEPDHVGERYSYTSGPAGIPAFIIGYHIPAMNHDDIPAIQLISSLLVQGESSRIYKRMVIEENAAVWVGGDILRTEDPGLFFTWAVLNYDVSNIAGEKQMSEEIERLKSELVSDAELEKAKNRIEADFYRQTRTLESRARLIGTYHVLTGDWQLAENHVKQCRAINKETVLEKARQYFSRFSRSVVYLNPTETKSADNQNVERNEE
jgi:zinc protease